MAIIGKYLWYEVKKDLGKTAISIDRLLLRRFNDRYHVLGRAIYYSKVFNNYIILDFYSEEKKDIVRKYEKFFRSHINRLFVNYLESISSIII